MGGSTPVTISRFGFVRSGRFEEAADSGGLALSHVPEQGIVGKRVTVSTLGDGLVEAVPDLTFRQLAQKQAHGSHGAIHGAVVLVANATDSTPRSVGRFGWKAQHGTIESASAHALAHELGFDNYLFTRSPASRATPSSTKADGLKTQLRALANFIRMTEPVAPDEARIQTVSAQRGSAIFDTVGCSICHVRTLRTAMVGTRLAGGRVTVAPAQANREFHPFSDFLVHDVGTGDGIMQNVRPADYDSTTANKFRTAPLWGIRHRSWLMHDGRSVTYHQAIERHAGEASGVVDKYNALPPQQKEDLRVFLDSL